MKSDRPSGQTAPPLRESGGIHAHSILLKSAAAVLILLLAAVLFCGAGAAASDNYADGQLFVCYEPGYFPDSADIIMDFSSTVPGLYLLRTDMSVPDAVSYYSSLPYVRYAEPDYCISLAAELSETKPNDPGYSPGIEVDGTLYDLWNMTSANAEKAWSLTTGSKDVIVAVVDTGINYNHEDLKGNMWTDENGYYGYNFVDNTHDPMDDQGHGTHCAGTVGAVGNNNKGIAGMAWNVSIMAVKVMDSEGKGTTSTIIQGIRYAAANGAKVISMSLGGSDVNQALTDAIRSVSDKAVVVAAAGNERADADTMPKYPASTVSKNVLSIAAIDNTDNLAYFSNYGVHNVDVAAPGENILSASHKDNSGYAVMSGTSMATPLVAGIAALLYSASPGLEPYEVVGIIKKTAVHLSSLEGKIATGGKVDAAAAVRTAASKGKEERLFYDIIFDSDGGSEVYPDIALKNGTADEPSAPVKSGYIFDGWYTAKTGGYKWNFSTPVTETMVTDGTLTLYARWIPKSAAPHAAEHDGIGTGAETAWVGTTTLPDTAGVYYLTQDVYLSDTWNVDTEITLCLNGQTISGEPPSGLLIDVKEGGALTLYDCTEEGAVSGYNINREFPLYNDTAAGPSAYGMTDTMPGAVLLTGPLSAKPTYIRGVSVDGTFTMGSAETYGGTLTNLSSPDYGGAVIVTEGGTFILNNGMITRSSAEYGGGVAVRGGTVTIKKGLISNCLATCGGGIHIENTGYQSNTVTLTMEGGTITGCAATMGGGMYAEKAGIVLTNAEIKNCIAEQGGGGMLIDKGCITMSGGEISGCAAKGSGSAVFGGGAVIGADFEMKDDAKITDCHAVSLNTGEMVMYAGGVYGHPDSHLVLRDTAEIRGCSMQFYQNGILIEEIPDNIKTLGQISVYDTASSEYLQCSLEKGILTNSSFAGRLDNISIGFTDAKGKLISMDDMHFISVEGGGADSIKSRFTIAPKQNRVFELKATGDTSLSLLPYSVYTPENLDVRITESGDKLKVETTGTGGMKIQALGGGTSVFLFKKDAPVFTAMLFLQYVMALEDLSAQVQFVEEIPGDKNTPYLSSAEGTFVSADIQYPLLPLETASGVSGTVVAAPSFKVNSIRKELPPVCTAYDAEAAGKVQEFVRDCVPDGNAVPVSVLSFDSGQGVSQTVGKVSLHYLTKNLEVPANMKAAVYQVDGDKVIPLDTSGTGGVYEANGSGLSTYVLALVPADLLTVTLRTGGTGPVQYLQIRSGSCVAEPDDPFRTGYIFEGWLKDWVMYDFTKPVTEDITLTAIWTVNENPEPICPGPDDPKGHVEINADIGLENPEIPVTVTIVSADNVSSEGISIVPKAEGKDPQRAAGSAEVKVYSKFRMEASPADGKPVKLTINACLSPGEKPENVLLRHYTEAGSAESGTGSWDSAAIRQAAPAVRVAGKDTWWQFVFNVSQFSPFALTYETPVKTSSSSRNYGTSIWLTETPAPTPLYSSERIIIKIDESKISVSDLPSGYEYVSLGGLGLYSAVLPAGQSADDAVRFFSGLDGVLYAEHDGYMHIAQDPVPGMEVMPVSGQTPSGQTAESPAPAAGILAGLGAAAAAAVFMRKRA